MVKSFRDLDLWKQSYEMVLDVYRLTNPFPRSEQFGIVSQLRRAAYSIPANIAEGYGRRSTRELLQFLSVANGSLEELRYFLSLSRDLRYLSPVDYDQLERRLNGIAQMVAALTKSLKNRLQVAGSQVRNTENGARNTQRIPQGASA